jgi:beta-galactosidase/beta-glucuronidase
MFLKRKINNMKKVTINTLVEKHVNLYQAWNFPVNAQILKFELEGYNPMLFVMADMNEAKLITKNFLLVKTNEDP